MFFVGFLFVYIIWGWKVHLKKLDTKTENMTESYYYSPKNKNVSSINIWQRRKWKQ